MRNWFMKSPKEYDTVNVSQGNDELFHQKLYIRQIKYNILQQSARDFKIDNMKDAQLGLETFSFPHVANNNFFLLKTRLNHIPSLIKSAWNLYMEVFIQSVANLGTKNVINVKLTSLRYLPLTRHIPNNRIQLIQIIFALQTKNQAHALNIWILL